MTSTSSTDVPSAISADALIIGFGKGGKTLAAKLASTGRTVVVAEASADMYGGTCINIGCLPSKSLILSADRARREGANRTAETREAAFEAAIREKRRVTAMLRDRNYHKLADQDNITVITGRARFTGAHSAEITTADGPVAVAADMMFINTGATPHIPDIPGIRTTPGVYTSTGLMDVDELPQRLVIIGAGFIGLEFASMVADFGTAVTVLQHSDEFLPREDEDVAAAIRAQLESQGVRFLFGADTKAITSADDGVRLSVSMRGASDVGSEARLCLSTDAVLVATGRTPNVEGLNLEAAGLDYVVKRLPVATVPKAQVMRRPEGMMKALVENGTDRILGAMLLAAESHEVINIVKLAMDLDAPASTLRDMMFTHPTMAEALNDLFA